MQLCQAPAFLLSAISKGMERQRVCVPGGWGRGVGAAEGAVSHGPSALALLLETRWHTMAGSIDPGLP